MNQSAITFKIIKKTINRRARVGEIHTPHGVIKTPSFMVAATKATVKSLTPEVVRDLGSQAVLANTYHITGEDIVEAGGGLGWL